VKTRLLAVVLLAALAGRSCTGEPFAATGAPDQSQQMIAASLSRLIENAIPLEYDKQKDWGATKSIDAGWNIEGKPFHWHALKREHNVNHGVWKHYKLKLVEPEKNLHVKLATLRPLSAGRVAFTLNIETTIDAWARAKVYEYGVHLIALEMESDMQVAIAIDGEVGVAMRSSDQGMTLALEPIVTNSRLEIRNFHLRRVSNARGPIVHELGEGVSRLVQDELNGPKLTEKLNRAIEKKRDRLAFRPAELFEGQWWPLSWATPAPAAPSPSPSAAGR
jgi:hypothetical protein